MYILGLLCIRVTELHLGPELIKCTLPYDNGNLIKDELKSKLPTDIVKNIANCQVAIVCSCYFRHICTESW